MLQNDIPDTNRDEKLQRLYFELEQAREDQRVSLDHIVQALVACIAALADIVFRCQRFWFKWSK